MIYVWIVLFVFLIAVCWASNLFGLPGNWLIVALAAIWAWAMPDPEQFQIGWPTIIILVIIAIVGEAIEFGASVLGTKRVGGSRQGAVFSVVGSLIGGVVGAVVGLPIPIVGWIVGSVLFACAGAMMGAAAAEKWQGKSVDESLKVGSAAFLSRLLGTFGKLILGSAMAVITVASLVL